MPRGTVKWFNATKGFGFIQPNDGGKDVFIRIQDVQSAGLKDLAEGQKVNYDIICDKVVLRPEVVMPQQGTVKGTVKWFNATKGFGFIQPDDGGKDVFVRIQEVKSAGLEHLAEGQKVNYDVVDNKAVLRPSAVVAPKRFSMKPK